MKVPDDVKTNNVKVFKFDQVTLAILFYSAKNTIRLISLFFANRIFS